MTLRTRLLWASGLLIVLLLLAAFAVTRIATSFLVGQVDEQLDRFVPAATTPVPVPPRFPTTDDRPPEDTRLSTLFLGSFDDGELTTLLSPNLGGSTSAVPVVTRAEAERLAESGQHASVSSTSDDTDYRIAVHTTPTTGELVVVGSQLTDVNAVIGRLITLQAVASGVVIALLLIVIWSVLRLGVRPLRQMTTAASEVAAGELAFQIPQAPGGTEAAQLGDALNLMLRRLEVAFDQSRYSEQRLRQFLADASHELRTPITTIRGYAELHRLGGLDDPRELGVAMDRVEAESVRMATMVENLLTLARLDQASAPSRQPVDLGEVVRRVVADLAIVHPSRRIDMQVTDVVVDGVADHLHQVVANLLTNAIIHTPAGTPVSVQLDGSPTDATATLRVSDRGPGMTYVDRERAFERFYRADPSRSRASGGSGLGLSIVAGIVREHGGAVWLEATDDRSHDHPGITVTVTLPARP